MSQLLTTFRARHAFCAAVLLSVPAALRAQADSTPAKLSAVQVKSSPTSIDASTPEMAARINPKDVMFVPMGRDAASLINLVPGAKKGVMWGAAGDAANNYQLDGVSLNHPGIGGDFLAPSIDWIEALEVRGLGAGAEYGNFQGGVINAITKSGTNKFQGALRTNDISPSFVANNLHPFEEGSQALLRRELSGEVRGPIVRDRLFYFVAGQFTQRNLQVPDLSLSSASGFRSLEPAYQDSRGLAKLSYLPGAHDRLDAIFGFSGTNGEHTGLNGIDGAMASRKDDVRTSFFTFNWNHSSRNSSLDVKFAGYNSSESRVGYAGDSIPSVQLYAVGMEPSYQNSPFNERLSPQSLSGNITWKNAHQLFGHDNEIAAGADYSYGSWKQTRSRNGGVTWRPYLNSSTHTVDVTNTATWPDEASDWGGDIHLNANTQDAALFVQDYFKPSASVTVTPGLRYGQWSGWLTPADGSPRFLAARAGAFDPRLGIVWNVANRDDLVFKAHWGRYHQGMNAYFFDRAAGGNVYTNERTYVQGPRLSSPNATFTPAQRDASGQFGAFFSETVLNQEGPVENYRQPYVDQAVFGVEKALGPNWKVELSYTNRINKDIVGLVDRNLGQNYSKLTNVSVYGFLDGSAVAGPDGKPLVLPVVWVANNDLQTEQERRAFYMERTIPGYSFDDTASLHFNQKLALTTVPGAQRRLDQLTLSLRTVQARWSAMASVTASRLYGNVSGLTGFSSNDTSFSAGPGVRPNEATNDLGTLGGYPAFESKLWISGKLPFGFEGGAFATFSLGDYYEPTFQISQKYIFRATDGTVINDDAFTRVEGQTIMLEQQGSRKLESQTNLDLRLERQFSIGAAHWAVTADLFNALGSDAVTARNSTLNNQATQDPTSLFGAARQRVNPRALQVGVRLIF